VELISTQPVVNAIFFPANSANIPDNYSVRNENVDPVNVSDPLELHNKVLPVIAGILKDNPGAKINLTGYTSGSDEETEDVELARRRAENVKKAFIRLGIESDRIDSDAALLPEYPSNTEYAEGVEENRRVDIFLENAPLQEFVARRNFERLVGDIETMVRYKNIPEQIPVMLSCSHSDTLIVCPYPSIYNININKRIDENFDESIIVRAAAADDFARDTAEINTDRIRTRRVELDVAGFKAFLRFDYNQSSLNSENKRLLRQLADKLDPGATIKILGGADRLGTRESNRELALERARTTRSFIESTGGKSFEYEIGINQKKFPEARPQGRFLNRSVKIEISD
jgi:outer membrane protein OmpA-like peptidoglycan-associated protein